MIITIRLQSAEEMAWLQPLLQQLQNAQVDISVQTDEHELQRKGQALLDFVSTAPFPKVEQVSIPDRDSRNAR